MCNCIDTLCDKLKEEYNHDTVKFENIGYTFDSGRVYYSEFNATTEVPLKNGKGVKTKKEAHSVIWSFCPFCGEKLK